MNDKNDLWIIKKIEHFPGEEFRENLYIGFKEDAFDTYKKIIKDLKNNNYEIFELEDAPIKGFQLETSFISLEPVKNRPIEKIIEKILM